MTKTKLFRFVLPMAVTMIVITAVFVFFMSNSLHVRARELERDFAAMETKLDSIELEPTILSDTRRAYSDQAEMLYQLGIGGVPLLMDRISNAPSFTAREAFYMDGVYVLLALDRNSVLSQYAQTNIDWSDYDYVHQLIVDSKTQIPAILNAAFTTEEKIQRLSVYGVLVIPYLDAISLTEDFTQYFNQIKLHLTPAQRTKLQLGDTIPNADEQPMHTSLDYKNWIKNNKNDFKLLMSYVEKLEV